MKLSWFLFSFFLSASRIGSVSASTTGQTMCGPDDDLITNTIDFINAITSASENPNKPSTICVDVDATIDFAGHSFNENGLVIDGKFFDAICVGYDQTNKCTIKRSSGGGRFFRNVSTRDDPQRFGVSFTGFEFNGGKATSTFGYGGAFLFYCRNLDGCAATFADCDFVDNVARYTGGAVSFLNEAEEASLTFDRCTFESNKVMDDEDGKGGAVRVLSQNYYPSREVFLYLSIHQTTFSDNSVNGESNDVQGENAGSYAGNTVLTCTDTVTSENRVEDVDVPNYDDANQTCSAPAWVDITTDDFEEGWGNFTKIWSLGSKDARRIHDSSDDNIPKGDGSLLIRDKGPRRSLVLHRDDHNVTGLSILEVSFRFLARGVERNEGFELVYSSDGGSSWTVVKEYKKGHDFQNKKRYRETVEITATDESYNFTSQARIGFRCKGSDDGDSIYLDEITCRGLPSFW